MTMKSRMNNKSRFTAIMAITASLGACMPVASQYTGASSAMRPEVEMVRLTHPIRMENGQFADGEIESLQSFLYINQVGYGDTLGIDASGTVDEGAHTSLASALQRNGLVLSGYRPVVGARPADGTLVLVVDRYVATPPPCPDTSQNLSQNFMNAPSPNYGCADATNLSLMVANPRDLIEGQTFEGTPVDTTNKAIRIMRESEPRPLTLPTNVQSSQGGGGGGGGGGSN